MESLMEFAIDKNSKNTKDQILNVANHNDTILIGDDKNPMLLAISFVEDQVILDIDNSNHQFDSLIMASSKQKGNFLQFEIEKVVINPDLTINLQVKNSSIKSIRIRPDEILRVNSKNLSTQVCSNDNLYTVSLPKNIFKHKNKIEGLDAFPAQFANCICDFEDAEVRDFTVEEKSYNIVKIGQQYYVSDDDFLRKCNIDNIKFSKSKDANVIQFDFGTSKKNLNNVSDATFEEICNFVNKDANDSVLNLTLEQIQENKENLAPMRAHIYYKNEALPSGDIAKFENEKPVNNQTAQPKQEKEKPAIKTETLDFSYIVKLLGFAMCMFGFFGGPLLVMILGVCICGSGYAFGGKLDSVKIPVAEKPVRKKFIVQKDKKQQGLSKQDLLKQRKQTLINYQTQIENKKALMETAIEQHKQTLADLSKMYSEATNDEEKTSIMEKINLVDKSYKKLLSIKAEFDEQEKTYSKLISKSYENLEQIENVVDISLKQSQDEYENAYNKTMEAQNTLNQLKSKQSKIVEQLKNPLTDTERAKLESELEQVNNQIIAQDNTYQLLAEKTQQTKNIFNSCQQSYNIYQDNMDGGVMFNNVENGMTLLNSYFQDFENNNVLNQTKNSKTKNKNIVLTK